MTSTTAKKTTKKAAPKAEFGARFEDFRDRAKSLSVNETAISDEPFILGKEDGFSAEYELPKPSFKARLILDDAMEKGDTIRVLRVVFGRHADAVLDDLDTYEEETGEDSLFILLGIVMAYIEHFYGAGSSDKVFTKLSI